MSNINEVLNNFELINNIPTIEFDKVAKEQAIKDMQDGIEMIQMGDFNELSNDFSMIAGYSEDESAEASSHVLDYDRMLFI
jgi:hypothetical protein